MIDNRLYNYKYVPGKRQVFNVLLGIGLIGFAVFVLIGFDIDITRIALVIVFTLLGIIPIVISIHYYIISRAMDIRIETGRNIVEVSLNGENETYKLENLKSVEIHEHNGLGLYEFDFDYAKYNFKDGKYFIATSFMTKDYYIPTGIEPKIKREFLPIIWKRTNI